MKKRILFLLGLSFACGFSICRAQTFEWAKRIGGPGEESCRTMALDPHGNIYLTGTFQGTGADFDPGTGTALLTSSGGSVDIFIAKYDPSGNYLWAHRIGGTGEDIPGKIAVDEAGNVLIAGWYFSAGCDFDPGPGTASLSPAGLSDLFFAKYDTGGNYIWARSMGSGGSDGCHDIRTDGSGNVFITGYFAGTVDFDPGSGTAMMTDAGGGDLYFAKYGPSGNFLWAKRAGGTLYEVGNGINIDDSGNIYLSGPFRSSDADFDPGAGTALLSTAGGYDMYLAKYDAAGNYLWAKRTGGSADELAGDVEFDRSGNVCVLGVYQSANIDFDPGPGTALLSSSGGWDVSVSKFTKDGNLLWVNGFGSTADDYYSGLTLGDDDFIYLSGLFSNTIDLNPGAGTVRATSAGGFDSFYAIYNPGGKYVWSKTLGGRLNENGGPVALDSKGDLFSAMSFNSLGVDMDPGSDVFSLSPAGGTDLAIMKFSLHPEPDTLSLIAFSNTGPDGNNEIYTVYPDGTGLKKLTNSPQRECGPAWSPDGSKIAYYIHYDNFTWSEFIMDADGTNSKRLTHTANVCDGPPAWSPDGKYIAFGRWYSQENYRAELWMMNADGTKQHRVGSFSGDHPSWSPDGSQLVICLQKNDRSSIAVVNPDGSGLTEISTGGTENWWPAWSPEGARIAFQSNRSGDHEIYVVRTDGSNPVRLTNNPGEDGEPDWSPDGTRIAYSSMVGGRYEIKLMNVDDTRPFRLVNKQVHSINPAWKPANAISYHDQGTTGEFPVLQSYPNPTGGQMIFLFSLDNQGPVVLDVVDACGRMVYSRKLGIKNAGQHSLAVDLTSQPAGQYFCKLTSGKNTRVKKVVKF